MRPWRRSTAARSAITSSAATCGSSAATTRSRPASRRWCDCVRVAPLVRRRAAERTLAPPMGAVRRVPRVVLGLLAAAPLRRSCRSSSCATGSPTRSIPTLQPLLEPGGVITGMDGVLFVRTSPPTSSRSGRPWRCSTAGRANCWSRWARAPSRSDQGADVRGTATVGSGDVQVGVNRPPGDDSGVAVHGATAARSAPTCTTSAASARSRARETYIAIGQSAPITTTQVTPGWVGPNVVQTTEYRDASTGFYATARLSGDDGDARSLAAAAAPQRPGGGRPSRPRASPRAVSGRARRVDRGRRGRASQVARPPRDCWSGVGAAATVQYTVWVKVEEAP